MDYEITAVIGFEPVLRSLSERFREVRVSPLADGLALIPVTEHLLTELNANDELPANIVRPDFSKGFAAKRLTDKLVAFIQESSGFGPLLYCEAEYEDGAGGQLAVLWQAQKIILGPLCTNWGRFGHPLNKVRLEEMAINTALRRLGVRPARGKDEFAILDLGRRRSTAEWC